MPLIADVAAGTIIQSAWGNRIRDRTVQYFASRAELTAGWPAAPQGALAYTNDTNCLHVFRGGGWVLFSAPEQWASGSPGAAVNTPTGYADWYAISNAFTVPAGATQALMRTYVVGVFPVAASGTTLDFRVRIGTASSAGRNYWNTYGAADTPREGAAFFDRITLGGVVGLQAVGITSNKIAGGASFTADANSRFSFDVRFE